MLAVWILALLIGYISAWSYPESTANGWSGTCQSGSRQSPIDLSTSMTANVHAPLKYKRYFNKKFNKHFQGRLMNDGNTVSWYANPSSTNTMRGGKKWKNKTPNIRDGPFAGNQFSHAYYLWKLEFHWGQPGKSNKGSEHTVNGKAYPLEMHMIHFEDAYVTSKGRIKFGQAYASPLGVAILSVFFQVDDSKPQNQAPLTKVDDAVQRYFGKREEEFTETELEELDENELTEIDHDINMRNLQYGFDQLRGPSEKQTNEVERFPEVRATNQVKLSLNVGAFIRKALNKGKRNNIAKYWTYKGSMTYPGCKEAVTWVVFKRSLPIAQVQVNSFGHLYSNNYRKPKTVTIDHQVQYLLHKN